MEMNDERRTFPMIQLTCFVKLQKINNNFG